MQRPDWKSLADLQKYRKRKESDAKLINDEVKETVSVTCRENFYQYLTNTTLHGLRYIGDKTLSILERYHLIWRNPIGKFNIFNNIREFLFLSCFFVLTFLLVLALSIYFISNVWMRWSAAPIIIALNSLSTSINDLPFPGDYLVDIFDPTFE